MRPAGRQDPESGWTSDKNICRTSGMRVIPNWTRTVGEMIAAGAVVTGACAKCEAHFPVDLEKVAKKHGELYSLWNRRPACPAKCGGRLKFSAMLPGVCTWIPPLHIEDHPDPQHFHAVWKADREAIRRHDAEWRFLRKRRGRRARIRQEAAKLMLYGEDALKEATIALQVAASDELALWAEIRLEVQKRLQALGRADLEAEV